MGRDADGEFAHTCAGCGGRINPGQQVTVTVTAGRHVITVYAHDGHRESAHANTMERSDWKRGDSYLSA